MRCRTYPFGCYTNPEAQYTINRDKLKCSWWCGWSLRFVGLSHGWIQNDSQSKAQKSVLSFIPTLDITCDVDDRLLPLLAFQVVDQVCEDFLPLQQFCGDDQPEPQAAAENLGQRAEVGLSDKILLWQPKKSALDEPRTLAQFQLSLPCCHDPPRRCEAPPPAKPGEERIFTRTAPASVS